MSSARPSPSAPTQATRAWCRSRSCKAKSPERMPKFYLTTAIDYSNGEPHLGHALEKVGADCIARYRRLRGDAVHFLMGMDEHSQSVIQAAARAGVTPQAWVDRMAATFADYWRRLHCSNDDWIRTTEPRHARAVAALLERIQQHHPADLFEAEYEGLYCTGCEEFKTGAQIVAGHCVEHPTLELIPTKERNHFFRLSAYRDAVLDRIRSGSFNVEPEIRRNEVLRLLEAGLQDISISRQRQPWGIPFPGARLNRRQPRVARAHDDRELPRGHGTTRPQELRHAARSRGPGRARGVRARHGREPAAGGRRPARGAGERREPIRRGDGALQAREAAGAGGRARLGARELGPHRRPDRGARAAVPPRYRGNRLGNGGIASPRSSGARPARGPRGAGSGGAAGPEASHAVP